MKSIGKECVHIYRGTLADISLLLIASEEAGTERHQYLIRSACA